MKRKIITTLIMMIIFISCLNINVLASYQIRPNYTILRNETAPNFWYNIRLKETNEGPMGLSMSVDKVYSGNDGNGIDVHMIKNSEWGAVAMLSMSGYGSGNGTDTWSTGNSTGVYALGSDTNWEYTSTFVTKDGSTVDTTNANVKALKDKNIDSRYYDLYHVGNDITSSSQQEQFYKYNYKKKDSSAKLDHKGDAYYEVSGIFSGSKYNVCPSLPFFLRGVSSCGGIFAADTGTGGVGTNYGTRAVVVCGAGLLCG